MVLDHLKWRTNERLALKKFRDSVVFVLQESGSVLAVATFVIAMPENVSVVVVVSPAKNRLFQICKWLAVMVAGAWNGDRLASHLCDELGLYESCGRCRARC